MIDRLLVTDMHRYAPLPVTSKVLWYELQRSSLKETTLAQSSLTSRSTGLAMTAVVKEMIKARVGKCIVSFWQCRILVLIV